MKNVFTAILVLVIGAANAQSKLTLDSAEHNFGTLKEGEKVVYEFTFTNTGNQPLVILSVTQPCGCTTPTYTKEPIAPGKQSKITVVYDSEGHPGNFNKRMQIRCNDPVQYYDIIIMGDVVPKPAPVPQQQQTEQ